MSSSPTSAIGNADSDTQAGQESEDGAGTPLPRHRLTRDVVVLHATVIAGLLVISIIMWWRVWVTGHPASTITCQCGDVSEALGFLAWTPWALIHGHNPFLSNAIYAGQGGANMLANASWMAFGLVFAPITWLFGPVATFNVVVTLAPVVSGWCLFLAVRRFTTFVPGQIVAAFLYGFSPIIVGSDPFGHFFQIWLIYPPLVLLCLYDLFVTQRHRPVSLGIGLGLLTVVQFFSSTEVLLIVVLVGVLGVAAAAVAAPRVAWARRRHILLGVTVAVGTAAILLAYPIWFAIDGPRHIVGLVWPNIPSAGASITGLVSAGPNVHQPAARDILSGYFGNRGPNPSYVGAAVMVFVGVSMFVWRKSRLAWIVFAVGLWSWLLSLGINHAWAPWRVFQHVPVVSDIIPVRISAITVFAVAVLVALSADGWWRLAVHRVEKRRNGVDDRRLLRVLGAILALVTAATLIPVAASYSFPFVIHQNPVPPWFRHVAPRLAPGTVLLTYPYPQGITAQAMGWQAGDDMRFRLAGGFVVVPGRDGRHSTFVSTPGGTVRILDRLSLRYLGPLPLATLSAVRQVRTSFRRWGVQVVVVTYQGRAPVYAVGYLTAVLGRLPRWQRGAWVWYGTGSDRPLSLDPVALTRCVANSPSPFTPQSDKLAVPKCVVAADRHNVSPPN